MITILMTRVAWTSPEADPDARAKLRAYAAFYVDRAQHAVRFQLLARDAAANDPAAAEVWAQMTSERLAGMTQFARHLADGGHLRAGLTVEDARDMLWTFLFPPTVGAARYRPQMDAPALCQLDGRAARRAAASQRLTSACTG
jgi:hypothetical protein